MTKDQVEKLIDMLADKEILSGVNMDGSGVKPDNFTISHPILLGDVLYRIAEQYRDDEFKNEDLDQTHLYEYSRVPQLCAMWYTCGKDESLQQIIENSGWEETDCDEPRCDGGHYPLGMNEDGDVDWGGACPKCKPLKGSPGKLEQLKSPQARALLEFINKTLPPIEQDKQ